MYAVMDPEKVRARAEEEGLDRQALADAAGVSMDTMRRIERAQRVTFYTSRKVARVLGAEPASLWHPEHSPHIPPWAHP
jgi:transcriptional regulator with XRE-family HTH domain